MISTAKAARLPQAAAAAEPLRLGVVVPCYRERRRVMRVLDAMPACVDAVYVVDDGCPEETGRHVAEQCGDERVRVIYHGHNQGVGAAMRSGYRAALADDMDVVVKLDGDGQMDPAEIARMVRPIAADQADYTKGNRFFRLEGLTAMPKLRLLGNVVLSFVSKLSTGYWQLFDPNNGFTAIDARVLALIPLEDVDDGYFFESDMLFRLNTLRAVVLDIPMRARYGDEQSSIRLPRVSLSFALRHTVNFFKRLFYNYVLRGFSVASVEWVAGPAALAFGILFGAREWVDSIATGVPATAGTVMLASLPTLLGMQMTLSAIHFDIGSEPTVPLRRLLADSADEPPADA
ncbi:MAG: glycosyltransferase family 2 protein [Gammaproteobacteria bacterium]